MSFTGQNCVDLARETLNDAAKTRYTDASLLLFLNAGLGVLALLRPDLFVIVAALATSTGSAEQDLTASDARALRLYEILRISGGNVIEKCDKDALDRFYPGWMIADAGNPENWMVSPEDPRQESGTKYFLSPPPSSALQVVAKYVQAPVALALADIAQVPDAYKDPLAHYIVFRAESKDDEHVVDQRAAQAMTVFLQSVGLAKEAKVVMNDGKPT